MAAVGVRLAVRRRRHLGRIWVLLALGTLPLCGVIAVSLVFSNFSILIPNRVAVLFVPPLLLLVGVALASISTGSRTAWLHGWAGVALLVGLSVWALGRNHYYTVPTKHPCRETIALLAQLERESDDLYLVSLDRLFIVHWAYPYYIRKFGLKTEIQRRPSKHRLPSLDDVERKARASGKRRLVLFQAWDRKFRKLVSEADRRYERTLVVLPITPSGGALAIYALDQPKDASGQHATIVNE